MKGGGSYVPPGYVPALGDDGTSLGGEISELHFQRDLIRSEREAERWTSGICACCDDFASCCLGMWCPCVLFGRNVEILEGKPWVGPCLLHCLLWGVLALGCCAQGTPLGVLGSCVSCYACGYRKALRTKYNLEDAPCGDFVTHFFCHTCAICQEYRELRERDTSYMALSITDPPSAQTMRNVADDGHVPLPSSFQSLVEGDTP